MSKEEMNKLREQLIVLRNECLSPEFDADGAVLLSHTISYLACKISGEAYEPIVD